MLPASNRGVGMMVGFPDVCNTPIPVGTAPIPYPNIGMNAQATGFSPVVKVSGMNALNMSSMISMTSGDEAGSAHPTTKGQGRYTMGNPIVFVDKQPAINLTCPTTGNKMNNAAGAVVVPSAVNVMYCRAEHVEPPSSVHPIAPGIAYVRLGWFGPNVCGTLRRTLETTARLIIDLRENPGGEAESALRLADRFVARGTVLALVDEGDGDQTPLFSRSRQHLSSRLVILVDQLTASAAELFAGVLQHQGRALLAGARTYGKATGVSSHRRASFWLPDGRPLCALAPDLPLTQAQLSMRWQAVSSSLIESGSI